MGSRWKSRKEKNRLTYSLFFVSLFLFLPLAAIANVKFEKKKLKIGSQTLIVEIADTSEKTAQGLMFRKKLPEGSGMLFVFPNEEVRSFWMKNTFIPLSIGYFNSKRELIDVQDMDPAVSEMQSDLPTYISKAPAQYALEVPKGWFAKHRIRPKQRFSLE